VPVVRFAHEEYRVGGAANVAHNVRALDARPAVVGLVGRDGAAERLMEEMTALQIPSDGLVCAAGRCTTRKLRVVTRRNQQVSRIDYEADGAAGPDIEQALIERIEREVRRADAVILSDYLKGTITRRVAARTIALAADRGVPVLVDPKVPHVDDYGGAALVTPNHHEAEAVTLTRIRTDEDARRAARLFRDRAQCASVLITRGEHGMWLLDEDRDYPLPATAREVSDVTGAGDTVIATLATAIAAGASLRDAAWLANRAAGLVVAKFGPAVVTGEELEAAVSDRQSAIGESGNRTIDNR
jgi:D-beta-D-heptose 7-phosphate kinase/D-beta-D-heptose 1-phosphate adenosyltransferase